MKHTFRTIFSVLLAAVMSLTVFASCDGLPFDDLDGPTEQIDVNRTQVVVGMYDGGIGTQWINSAKKKFEELYKDVSFETGKTGVQIVVHKTTSLSGSGVGALLPTIDDEIIFCEGADYYNLVNMGSLLDITDLLTEDLSSMGDVGTIEDKIPDTYKNFLNVNGKYYGLPFYEGTYGLFYDISLFESYGFYYDNNNTLIKQGGTIDAAAGLFTTKAGEEIILGTGPDGLNNTYDDGLPRTYDEFFALCDYIYKKGVTPISWPGQYIFHMDNLLKALAVDDAGFKQDQLFFNFSGTATDLVEMDGNGKVVYENGNIKTYSQEINNSNGYLLSSKISNYNALSFMHRLFANTNYYDEHEGFSSGVSHYMAQERFLSGKYSNNINARAMLADGTWWYNESREKMEEIKRTYGESNYGLLPLPKSSLDKLGTYTIRYVNSPLCFIKSVSSGLNPNKIEVCKLFFKFINTRDMLADFIKVSDFSRLMNYELTQDEINSLSAYAKNMYDTHINGVYSVPLSDNDLFLTNYQDFYDQASQFNANINGQQYSAPCSTMYYYNDSISAKDYFEGVVAYHNASYWRTIGG